MKSLYEKIKNISMFLGKHADVFLLISAISDCLIEG